ncbi:MAG: hypothetical protein M3154_05205 [Candidatus Eremiobacteraeota bacterium]|nr:hypothetical protein [Candidatus Eremiobacteraeota bacterium]
MQLFPERYERRGRRLLPTALILSFVVHLVGWGVWLFVGGRIAPTIAAMLPHPSPTPEIVALSDAITIEKRAVPRPAHHTRPSHRATTPQRRAAPLRSALAPLPVPTLAPVPVLTLAPAPTSQPSIEPARNPVYRAAQGTVHRPRAVPTPEPRRVAEQPTSTVRNGFSAQQLAQLNARFQHTIASAQRSLSDVPLQSRPPARAPDQRRYEKIMAGTPEMFLAAQGDCVSLADTAHGPTIDRILRCQITYSDGYFENVTFPWRYRFSRRSDPFQYSDGNSHPFPMQAPPDAFPLPHPFALSRAVCSFYQAQCARIIEAERANGNQPAPAAP